MLFSCFIISFIYSVLHIIRIDTMCNLLPKMYNKLLIFENNLQFSFMENVTCGDVARFYFLVRYNSKLNVRFSDSHDIVSLTPFSYANNVQMQSV